MLKGLESIKNQWTIVKITFIVEKNITGKNAAKKAKETAEGTFSAVHDSFEMFSHVSCVALFIDPCYWQRKSIKRKKKLSKCWELQPEETFY